MPRVPRIVVRPRMTRIRGRVIDGLRAAGWLVHARPEAVREWVATGLPRPPAAIRRAVRGILGGGDGWHVILRSERRTAAGWRPTLTTRSVHAVTVSAATFAVPRRYRRRPAGRVRRLNAASARLVKRDPLLPPLRIPVVTPVYWGREFTDSAFVNAMQRALTSITSGAYLQPAGQYGVHPGAVVPPVVVPVDPPPDVGAGNGQSLDARTFNGYLNVLNFVNGLRDQHRVPSSWPRGSLGDPLIAIFVPASKVDVGAWAGYHMFVPDLGPPGTLALYLLFFHPMIPFLVVKVPDAHGLPNPAGDTPTDHPFADTTQYFSHELIEAATNVVPLAGWSDPTKPDPFVHAEPADICLQEAGSDPDQPTTRPGGQVVSTYWSNADNRCVPASATSVSITQPQPGASVPCGYRQPVHVDVRDPIDDPPAGDRLSVEADGFASGTGFDVLLPHLPPGPQTITATYTNLMGGTGSTTTPITVTPDPPALQLTPPAPGTLHAGTPAVFHGVAQWVDGPLDPGALQWTASDGATGQGATFVHAFAAPGTYTVTLTASAPWPCQYPPGATTVTVDVGPPASGPTVAITQPQDGAVLPDNQPSTFVATATAPDGDPVEIDWTDDDHGPMGSGSPLVYSLAADNGCPYPHTVTATARDLTTGATASDAIHVTLAANC